MVQIHLERSIDPAKHKADQQTCRREAAHKTGLAKGEVGIVEKQPAPTLELFSERFMQAISVRSAEKPRTVAFYQEKLNRLLEYPKMACATLDAIDEALIEEYVKERRKQVAPATRNSAPRIAPCARVEGD